MYSRTPKLSALTNCGPLAGPRWSATMTMTGKSRAAAGSWMPIQEMKQRLMLLNRISEFSPLDARVGNAIRDIDKAFEVGYAKAHPELIGAYMMTAAIDFGTTTLAIEIGHLNTTMERVWHYVTTTKAQNQSSKG
jgi:hypothetical protein